MMPSRIHISLPKIASATCGAGLPVDLIEELAQIDRGHESQEQQIGWNAGPNPRVPE